jgi:transposase InsO family protein
MPWSEMTKELQRKEFVSLALVEGSNMSHLCERFGISRKTGYKWLARYDPAHDDWAQDYSRRPRHSPFRVSSEIEKAAVEVRRAHPTWSGKKIRKRLQMLGWSYVPAASTITAILRRHDLIDPRESLKHGPGRRFEREHPNELWQMDFKGPVKTATGRCHPLTVIDDHSRYAVCVTACEDESGKSVQSALTPVFRTYGLPERMLMDNGSCWGKVTARFTVLNVWMLRLGIRISHGRPYHPQTQGKNERFNRTLKVEALTGYNYHDLADCQRGFDRFRHVYNHERPHEALGMETPASRYRISVFAFPEKLPPMEYCSGDIMRKVGPSGCISYHKVQYQVGRAFTGEYVAIRGTHRDGIMAVYYCYQKIATINLRDGTCNQD